jgi:hypothetical protein
MATCFRWGALLEGSGIPEADPPQEDKAGGPPRFSLSTETGPGKGDVAEAIEDKLSGDGGDPPDIFAWMVAPVIGSRMIYAFRSGDNGRHSMR